jgi:hypothetical protein
MNMKAHLMFHEGKKYGGTEITALDQTQIDSLVSKLGKLKRLTVHNSLETKTSTETTTYQDGDERLNRYWRTLLDECFKDFEPVTGKIK